MKKATLSVLEWLDFIELIRHEASLVQLLEKIKTAIDHRKDIDFVAVEFSSEEAKNPTIVAAARVYDITEALTQPC